MAPLVVRKVWTRRAAALVALVLALLLVAAPAFATTLSFITTFGSYGTGSSFLRGPLDVAINDTTGRVYVADAENARIEWFDFDGQYVGQQNGWGTAGGFMTRPTGVAVNQTTGDVYAADSGSGYVFQYQADGAYVRKWGGFGSGNGQFTTAWGIDINQSTGNVYVVDGSRNVVQYFTSSGTYIGQFGVQPVSGVTFTNVYAIAINQSNGNVYIVDGGADTVQYFSSTGTYLGGWTETNSSRIMGAFGLAVHPSTGDVYIASGYTDTLLQYSATGTYIGTTGSSGSGVQNFNTPAGLHISGYNSRIYLADYDNNRIQVLSTDPVTPPAPASTLSLVGVDAASWWSLGLLALGGLTVVALTRRRARTHR